MVTLAILGISRLLFGVTVRGSWPLLLLVVVLFQASCLGMGLLISTVVETQHMAFTFSALLTIMPAFLLSGFIFPIRNMPPVIQAVTLLFPARYFLAALRALMIRGAGLSAWWGQLVGLLVFGAATFCPGRGAPGAGEPPMSRVGTLVRKELQQIRRDRRMLRIILIGPVLQLIVLGYAANLDVREIPVVVCDLDRGPAGRGLQERFFRSGYFRRAGEAEEAARGGPLAGRRAGRPGPGHPARLRARPGRRGGGAAAAHRRRLGVQPGHHGLGLRLPDRLPLLRAVLLERMERRGLPLRPVVPDVRARVWYNPELKSRNFMVPGLLAQLLLLITMLLTSLAVVKEKESGTLEQLIVTPLKPVELILGKLLPFVLIGFIDIFLVLGVTRFLFGLELRGSLALLVLLSGVFLLSTLGLGLLVSTLSRTQQQAMMSAVFFVMLPMIMLSGFVFPIENMPPADPLGDLADAAALLLRHRARAVPQRRRLGGAVGRGADPAGLRGGHPGAGRAALPQAAGVRRPRWRPGAPVERRKGDELSILADRATV